MKSIVLRISYLTGRSIATAYDDRERAEWPPHPARVYAALVATWAESEEREPRERTALEWLAKLAPPKIKASEASSRQVVPHFVPVNDTAVLDAFTRQREKLESQWRAHEEAKMEYQRARDAGDEKQGDKAAKALSKAEKTAASAQKKLQQLLVDDQEAGKQSKAGLEAARAMLPEQRGKQARTFPSVSPAEPQVFLLWEAEESEIELHGPSLEALAARIVRVGHSSSLVACTVVEEAPAPNWEPHEDGKDVLRVPGPGQLLQLEAAFELHREVEPRVLPCRFQRYRQTDQEHKEQAVPTVFDADWIVFRQVRGRRLMLTSCVEVARAMRGALMKYAEAPPTELLSGHLRDGTPSKVPHLAIVPLPFVANRYATGELLGLTLVFPRAGDEAQRTSVLRAIGRWEEARRLDLDDEFVDTPPLDLMLGRAGAISIERVEWGRAPLKTLRAETWSGNERGSYAWVTATPIALDHNPGNLFSRDPERAAEAYSEAERSIATACERIGLPRPRYVQVHPSVPLRGAAKARAFPPFPADPKKHQRVKVHARIEFPVRVQGPVLLGAGRYHGLGLCYPQPNEARVEA